MLSVLDVVSIGFNIYVLYFLNFLDKKFSILVCLWWEFYIIYNVFICILLYILLFLGENNELLFYYFCYLIFFGKEERSFFV